MGDEPDADRIRQERELRRAAERARVEDLRRARQLELARLQESERLEHARWSDERTRDAPRVVIVPSLAVPPSRADGEELGPALPRGARAGPRPIGGSIAPPAIEEFLKTNPTEGFDIVTLNSFRFPALLEAAQDDPRLLAMVGRRAEALMLRVKQEVDDPLIAGAFLRDQLLRWYRESPSDPEWVERTPDRWAGLFSDSRISGGKLLPWVNVRLWSLRETAFRGGRLREKVRRGILRDHAGEAATERTASQLINAEVAQAILDDLATNRREAGQPLPLVRLSDLAVRRQVATVNDALAVLFNAPESGPFVILHPNRYPDVEELQIRPPTPGASGAAMAYPLAPGRAPRRGGPRAGAGDSDGARERAIEEDARETEVDEANPWEATAISPARWPRVLEALRQEKRRLDSPPKDYRTRPPYGSLVDQLLGDADTRRAFLAVKWRGRPAGLPLLVSLLQKGTLAPDVATDHEYLEAELIAVAGEGTPGASETGPWLLPGWRVSREGSHRDGFRYRAEKVG